MDAKPVPFQVTRRGTNSFSVTFPETPICTKEQNLPVRDILRDNWQSFANASFDIYTIKKSERSYFINLLRLFCFAKCIANFLCCNTCFFMIVNI